MLRNIVSQIIIGLIISIFPLQAISATGERSDFVDFRGAPEDEAVIQTLLQNNFTINPPKRIVYVAPFIQGSTLEGTGQSPSDPKRNLLKALESAEPGDHFYLAPGIYRIDKERDNFNNAGSQFILRNGGTSEDRIVVTTDPGLLDPKNGQIAQLDFGFNNTRPGKDRRAFALYSSYWVFENLEIRNFNDWGFYISGHYNLIRNNNIHHVNQNARNNYGLIVQGGRGELNNLIMRNHLHHSGLIDTQTGTFLPPDEQTDGQNGGCTYSVTQQHYDIYKNLLNAGIDLYNDPTYPWKEMTWAELSQYFTPPDNEAYFYNNLVDHCFPYGLGTKNEAEGKFYFLSNVVHQARVGIKISLSHSVIRNNIVYSDDGITQEALALANSPNGKKIVPQIINGIDISITNNTFAGMDVGVLHRGGWNSTVTHNLFLDIPNPHQIRVNNYAWDTVSAEYLYGDLSSNHPYFDKMPQALKDRVGVYKKLEVKDNIYTTIPFLTKYNNDVDIAYLPNDKISDDYTVLSSEIIKAHMINPAAHDFRINPSNPGPLIGIGSGILPKSGSVVKPSVPTLLRVD